MAQINLENLLPCLNIVKSVLSAEGDALAVNIENNNFIFYNYDRSREFQIFGQFKNVCSTEDKLKFTISLEMLRTLLRGKKSIDVELTKEGLICKTSSFTAVVEYSKADTITYPVINTQNFEIDKSIYTWIRSVKLNTLFNKEDMFVFIKYFKKDSVLRIACADNYHTSMLTVHRKVDLNIDTVLPVKYIEYANKLIESDKGARFLIEGDSTYFCNKQLILKTPTVAASEDVSFSAIIEHNDRLKKTSHVTKFSGIKKIKNFLQQARGIKEEDRDNQVHIYIRPERIKLFIETRRGNVAFKLKATSSYTDRILVNSRALSDVIDRIQDDQELEFRLNEGNLYVCYNQDGVFYESTIVGTAQNEK